MGKEQKPCHSWFNRELTRNEKQNISIHFVVMELFGLCNCF
ncbi:hypothetical protein VVMO6_02534 [Vibrio vulnificus MO6-24/O]|nr:hypothetical protein VVMO6_02534 [Vibrio vulnificus MO6-24/O]